MLTTKAPVACFLAFLAPASAAAQVFAGPEFRVIWSAQNQPSGESTDVVARRFDAAGTPLGGDILVNTYTAGVQGWRGSTDAAVDRVGNLVVVWASDGQDGSYDGVFGQRLGASGAPVGAECQVNTYTTGDQGSRQFRGSVAVTRAPDGRFVVVWMGGQQDGSGFGIFGQRYDAAGAPAGAEFRVNTNTTDAQTTPDVAMDGNGNLVVVWSSFGQDGSLGGVFGRRFAASGAAQGSEFQVNTNKWACSSA